MFQLTNNYVIWIRRFFYVAVALTCLDTVALPCAIFIIIFVARHACVCAPRFESYIAELSLSILS